jgi:hypothetical protein
MKRMYLLLSSFIMTMMLLAQEKTTDVNINVDKNGGGSFWGSPWMWVLGAAIFIILLVAVARSGSRQ